MRKGLTLIELILSMVIIGVVFTVIPRLVMSMNQNAQVTIKEEIMFNAITYLGKIIYLSWDQHNTTSDNILITAGNSDYECSDGIRKFSFPGGRLCHELNQSASSIGHDSAGNDDYNDIDDYDQNTTTPTINCNGNLRAITKDSAASLIGANIVYVDDPTVSSAFELSSSTSSSPTTNTKMVTIQIGGCSILSYHSFNIGRAGFASKDWN